MAAFKLMTASVTRFLNAGASLPIDCRLGDAAVFFAGLFFAGDLFLLLRGDRLGEAAFLAGLFTAFLLAGDFFLIGLVLFLIGFFGDPEMIVASSDLLLLWVLDDDDFDCCALLCAPEEEPLLGAVLFLAGEKK